MKFLHTMLRVTNLEKSIKFYTQVLKLQLIRRNDFSKEEYTLVFLGYGKDEEDILLELTYNWKITKYDLGEGFGHLAFTSSDLINICSDAVQNNGEIRRGPGILKTSQGKDVVFITDPDGYVIEIIDNR